MKALLTAKRLTGILALLLAIMMLFAACGGTETTDNGDQTDDQVSDAADDTNDDADDDADDGDDADDTADDKTVVAIKLKLAV